MGIEDQTMPVPAVLPWADKLKTPPELPDGATMELCEMGFVLNVEPLNA
jgi:hypothetical protein